MIPDTPCSCGGNNENCFRCGGLGFYGQNASQKDRVFLPVAKHVGNSHKKAEKPQHKLQNPNRINDSKKPHKAPQSRDRISCGICNQLFLTTSLLSLHHSERHMCSIKVQIKRKIEGDTRITRAKAVNRKDAFPSSSKVICATCGKRLKSETGVAAHRAAVHASEPLHLKILRDQKRHAKPMSDLPLGSTNAARTRPTYHQIPSSVAIASESKLDGSRDYYKNYRESGKLGSHASHDAYGDEDFA